MLPLRTSLTVIACCHLAYNRADNLARRRAGCVVDVPELLDAMGWKAA